MTEPTTRTGTCVDCKGPIEQTFDEELAAIGLSGWKPLVCPACDAERERKGQDMLARDEAARKRANERERLNGANVRPDMSTGRITLDRLPELYEETRIAGGVDHARYRELVVLVKDFISIPRLLRSADGIKSILLLHGERGTGKTWLLEAAIAHVTRELGQSATFTSPLQVWSSITSAYNDQDDREKTAAQIIGYHTSVGLLGIDDFTRKTRPTEWEIGILLQIIDERYRNSRPTIITMNDDPTLQIVGVNGIRALWLDDDPRRSINVNALCDRLADKRAAISIAMNGKSLRRQR